MEEIFIFVSKNGNKALKTIIILYNLLDTGFIE